MNLSMIPVMNPRGKPMAKHPLPPLNPRFDRDSIAHAKAMQQADKRAVAQELGIPSALYEFWDVYTPEQMKTWTRLIETLRS